MSRSTRHVALLVVLVALTHLCEAAITCTGGPNDQWTDCGPRCIATCENPNPGPCMPFCVRDTCRCKTGYVRRFHDSQCVTVDQCPGKIPRC